MKTIVYCLILILPLFAIELHGQGMEVGTGTNITVQSGTIMTINNGDLLLKDDLSTSPSFLDRGNLVFAGTAGKAHVEQFVNADQWSLVSSPLSDGQIGTYIWMYLYQWDEPTSSWNNLSQPITIPMNPGEGYNLWPYTSIPPYPASADSAVFAGTLNRFDVEFDLDYTVPNIDTGWNVIGNPFPCAIDWNSSTDWNRVNVDATAYFWKTISGGTGQYATWNYNTGIGTNGKFNGYIPATQGFWVHANSTVASLTLPASQRLHSDTTAFFKNLEENILRFTVSSNDMSVDNVIAFMPGASMHFDTELDGYYMAGTSEINLFSHLLSTEYAVNILNSWEENPIIPVSFRTHNNGLFILTFTGTETFPSDLPIHLKDLKEDKLMNLRTNPVYTFSSKVLDNTDRFEVWFKEALGVDDQFAPCANIYAWEKMLYFDLPVNTPGKAMVYNLQGQLLEVFKLSGGHESFPISISNNEVIVKLITTEISLNKKIFIR